MRHVFLDLETLALGSRPAIVQIGLVVFDADRIVEGHRWEVDYGEDIRAGGEVDGDTLRWWFAPERNRDATLLQGLYPGTAIHEVMRKIGEPLVDGYWANGIDWVWLESMWRRYYGSIPFPVHYNAVRDLRTLRKTVGRDIAVDRDATTMHDALQDAIWGARWLQEAHRKLGNVL